MNPVSYHYPGQRRQCYHQHPVGALLFYRQTYSHPNGNVWVEPRHFLVTRSEPDGCYLIEVRPRDLSPGVTRTLPWEGWVNYNVNWDDVERIA